MKRWALTQGLGRAAGCTLLLVVATFADAEESVQLPPVTVIAPRPPDPTHDAPSGANGGNANNASGGGVSFQRLNQELKRKVDKVHPTANVPPIDARSPDTKIGVINIPGVQQQYGQNFGRSAVPYRPPAAIYSPPLGNH